MAVDWEYNLDENVENLIERPEKEFVKSPRYESIHKERVIREAGECKSSHRTLGQPRHVLVRKSPSHFLRKGDRIEVRKVVSHEHIHNPRYVKELPEWKPAKARRAVSCGKVAPLPQDPVTLAGKDFKKRNVRWLKTLKPPVHPPRVVDDHRGNVQDLKASGLLPVYIYGKNFGEVPEIIKQAMSVPNNVEECPSNVEPSKKPKKNGCRYVTEDERAMLLAGMKKKWAELMKQFQCLPFLTDTIPKIKRKAKLEDKLKQIEKDIDLIENHPFIYVYEENNNNHRRKSNNSHL